MVSEEDTEIHSLLICSDFVKLITHGMCFVFHGKQSYHYGYNPVTRIVYDSRLFTKIVYDTKQVRHITRILWFCEPYQYSFSKEPSTIYIAPPLTAIQIHNWEVQRKTTYVKGT